MEKHIGLEGILGMEPHYRRNLMNSISGFKSCNLIGTSSYRGVANVAIFNSVVHIGATPPLLGFVMRPLTVPRQTYHNIKAHGFFTINAVAKDFYEKAHQTSAKYGEQTSEFEACGLTPQYTDAHPAPYVKESPVRMGLQLEEEHHIRANGTIFLVGKVVEILAEGTLIALDGHLGLDKAGILAVAGLDSYYEAELLGRLGYARV
ncbi:MAG: flavin reductase [Lewinellaceae bacterium]|nr:flavin reductase [Phaeodactylibacter sp.]MCB9039382.1 flavin reductase [Lewinellaceae bacterium]